MVVFSNAVQPESRGDLPRPLSYFKPRERAIFKPELAGER